VGNLYPPHHLGGYELVWQATVRALRDRGHDVRVLCTDTYLDADRPGDEDADVHRALRWYWRDHGWPRLRLRDRRRVERHERDVVALHVRDFGPDAIGFFAMGGGAEDPHARAGVDQRGAGDVEPDDPAAVAAAIRRLADDPALRARVRHGGIATAKEYTAERFHARVEAALADAVRVA
jgi:hypothetical protein